MKKESVATVNEPTVYLDISDQGSYHVIKTTNGELIIPKIRQKDADDIKSEGWTLLADEYYNTDPIDLLVLRFYEEPRTAAWVVHKDRPLDNETHWWSVRCGEAIPPYNWDGHPTTTAHDYVVAWKPHEGETEWKGLVKNK